jgi:hypothetical protein
MDSRSPSAAAIGHKLGHELREYAVVAAYLYICFGALILYKTAILHAAGIGYMPLGLAAIKALVLGKFILVAQAVKIGDRYVRRRFIHVIVNKSLLFLAVLFVLSVIEEAIVAVIHGRSIVSSFADVGGSTLLQILASCLVMLLILIPYLTFKELDQVLGEGRLRQILFDYRARQAG